MSVADWAAIAGVVVASIGIIVSAVAVVMQSRQSQTTVNIENLNRAIDQWDSTGMQRLRSEAAAALQQQEDGRAIPKVLSFFEQLGYLVSKKALDAESVWTMFSDWILPYWVASEYFTSKERDHDSTYWECFRSLNVAMPEIEARRRKKPAREVTPTPADVAELLVSERDLIAHPDERSFRSWRRH